LHNIYAVLQVYVHISVSHLDNEPCEKERWDLIWLAKSSTWHITQAS
jgi:hypothetical protein